VDPTSLDFWEWFYEPANEGASMSSGERLRSIEARWHPDLVLIQSSEMPGTAGEFRGYEGLAAANRELFESWQRIDWRPREVHDLGDQRYLILLDVSGRGSGSGILLEGGDIGHIVTLRDGKAARLEVHLGWDTARQASGLG
jgi:hypothetical protein